MGLAEGADAEQGAETAAQWNAFSRSSVRELRSARSGPLQAVQKPAGPEASRSR